MGTFLEEQSWSMDGHEVVARDGRARWHHAFGSEVAGYVEMDGWI
jgi:hypothetical protein